MPGRLRTDRLALDDPGAVRAIIDSLSALASDSHRHHRLHVSKRYYFSVPDGPLPSVPGWYIIRSSNRSLYVGTAEDLDARLNSEPGSRDQFANPKRQSDPERNFIKAFRDSGVLDELWVVVVPEPDLVARLGLGTPLTRRDRHSVEKILNLFRETVMSPEGRADR